MNDVTLTPEQADLLKKQCEYEQFAESMLESAKSGNLRECETALREVKKTVAKHDESRNIAREVGEWVNNAVGIFFSTDVDKELNIPDKRYRSKLLTKLAEDGIIEPCKERQGKWRKVDKVRHKVKWWESSGNSVDIKLPLGIHEQVIIYPHTMIAVAGLWSAGKTAMCMGTAVMNYGIFDDTIDYILCSEMGPNRFRRRLMSGGVDLDLFKKHVEVFEYVGGNIADLIRPDKLTIIDYIAPQAEGMWRINKVLNDINDKIDDGIVMVAMQKPGDRDTAFGGDFSAMVPSVYISINDSVAKITKAKEFREEVSNPAGKVMSFQLRNGFHFDSTGVWHRKSDEEELKKYPNKWSK